MKTKTLLFKTGLATILFLLATISLFSQIQFEGLHVNHEGLAAWNADGSGPEPYGIGHLVPFPGFSNLYYYGSSCDYDNVDPDPQASGGHFLECFDGFPAFQAELNQQGVDIETINVKMSLNSLEDDEEGVDWMVLNDYHYNNYYCDYYYIYMQDELMIKIPIPYTNFKIHRTGSVWLVETGFAKPLNASENSNDIAKELAMAFLQDIDDESLQITFELTGTGSYFNTNGREGSFYNLQNGLITKGTPELPFIGKNTDHEGFAGWDADGTGPEPEGNGHNSQFYYVASLDYDDLDDDPEAALGHFIDGSKGFRNLLLQLEYRGYDLQDMQITVGLTSMGDDVYGTDWNYNWCNYYNNFLEILIGQEPILQCLADTNVVYPGWSSATSGFGPVNDISDNASEAAKYVAGAFLMDMGDHQMTVVTDDFTGGSPFEGNGRNGYTYEINEAKVMGKYGMVNCIEPGILSGTLTADGSPYLVNGHITVPDGEVLTIEPGTHLAFRGPYHIKIEGAVNALGTEENPILFTHSNPLLRWDGFDADAVDTENDSSLFDHCVFEYGYGYGTGPYNSGGIFAVRNYDKLAVKNSNFAFNVVETETTYYPSGGAVALWNSNPLFMNCVFHNNTAEYGGAIMAYENSDPIISNCLFFKNNCTKDAGAVEYYINSDGLLLNCTFVSNFAGVKGGAIDCYDHSSPTIINTVFWNDSAAVNGNEVNLQLLSHPDFYNCDIRGGEDGIGGSYLIGDFENCIDEDPLFLNMGEFPYQINDGSPCIDAGNADTLSNFLPEYDLAGLIRIYGNAIDIGAYEWNETVAVDEITNEMNSIKTYPNPFVTSTTFEFVLDESVPITLEVYNILGEKVEKIEETVLPKGKHTIHWSPDNLTTGVYFVLLRTGHTTYTQKVLKQ